MPPCCVSGNYPPFFRHEVHCTHPCLSDCCIRSGHRHPFPVHWGHTSSWSKHCDSNRNPSMYAYEALRLKSVHMNVLQDFLSSSKEVSVAIGIDPCSPSSCLPSNLILGRLLYSGSYNPRWDSNKPFVQPYQNFSVTVPTNIPKGWANVGVAHFALIGVHLVQLYINIKLIPFSVWRPVWSHG